MFLVCILCCATIITVPEFSIPAKKPHPHQQSPPAFPLPAPDNQKPTLWTCLLWTFPISGVTPCALLCLLLSRALCFQGCVKCITLFCAEKCSPARRDPAWGFCSAVGGCLGSFRSGFGGVYCCEHTCADPQNWVKDWMRGEGGAEIVEGRFRKLVLFQDASVGVLDRKETVGPTPGRPHPGAPPRAPLLREGGSGLDGGQ